MSLATNISSLVTRIGTEFKAIRTLISGTGTGDVSGLTTTATHLVGAINEVKTTADAAAGGGVSINDAAVNTTQAWSSQKITDEIAAFTPASASETVAGIVELATTAEATTGTDTVRAVTPAGVAAAVAALVDSAPGTLDTLNELAAALGDDPNFATTITDALALRVRVDAAQAFTAPQQAQGRANIDAASATDVGPTNTDYVAAFNAALV